MLKLFKETKKANKKFHELKFSLLIEIFLCFSLFFFSSSLILIVLINSSLDFCKQLNVYIPQKGRDQFSLSMCQNIFTMQTKDFQKKKKEFYIIWTLLPSKIAVVFLFLSLTFDQGQILVFQASTLRILMTFRDKRQLFPHHAVSSHHGHYFLWFIMRDGAFVSREKYSMKLFLLNWHKRLGLKQRNLTSFLSYNQL